MFMFSLRNIMRKMRGLVMKRNNKIDETLKELLIAILVFEVLAQIIGMIVVACFLEGGIVKYTVGLWIGAALAFASAWHMWWSIDRNLSVNADREGAARAFAIKQNLIRYAVVLVVFVSLCLTTFSYPLAAFLGIMGLKAGAYMQPFIKKIMHRSLK